jgi:subtilisin family serine protease
MKRFLVTAATATLFLSLPVASMARADQDESEGSYIVVMRSSDDLDGEEAEISKSGGRTEKRFSRAINALSVKVKHSEAARIRNNPKVLFVELDQPMYALDTQNPTPSWGLDRIDQRALPLNSAFTASAKGAGVDTYIVDTGISSTHTDFTGRMSAGFSSIIDGNGTNDCNGHGTHVAGTTAGTTYGIAKSATLIPVRVLDCLGSGTNSGVIAGLDWIISHHTAGTPAVANMSLGGGASAALDLAVQNVINDGVVMAVAAGNSNVDACNSSPARAVNAITVGSTTTTDARSSFSNIGACVDIFAPGSSITSAWIGSTTAISTISGTSMASPHVAGVAAVLLGRFPTSTTTQIATMLRTSATPNVVTSAGTGSPNYLLYLDPVGGPIVAPPPPTPVAPSAPTGITITPSSGSLSARFTAGAAGTSPITTYKYSVDGGANWLPRQTGTTASPIVITGLNNGTPYAVSIRAVSIAGDGTATTSVIATPSAPALAPSAPTIGSAVANARLTATVTWTQGANGGSAITSHIISAYLNGSVTPQRTVTITGSSATSGTITNLTNRGTYTFRVSARNAIGTSALSLSSNAVIARR